jgi:hypothetical protein
MNTSDDRSAEREEALAAGPLDGADYAILNSIRAYYDENDPVPDGLVERIQFELTLDRLNAEVATLTQLDLTASGARGSATEDVRTITFSSESLTTMVTLTPTEDGVRIDGWAAPAGGLRVEVLLADGPRETYCDDDGRFVFEGLPSGLAKFALYLPHGDQESVVITPTIEL